MSNQGAVDAVAQAAPVNWSPTTNTAASDHGQLISFAIGDDQYGVDIMSVREIKSWSAVNHLPGQPEYMRGVLNLRGVMVPIIDLRCRFGQGLTEATPLHVVIIVQIDAQMVGLIVDQVSDIVSVDPSKVQPVPQMAQQLRSCFLSGLLSLDDEMIALIDLPRLVTLTTISDLNEEPLHAG